MGRLIQALGIAMAHRWLRLAAAMEVEDWRLRHPGVAPVPARAAVELAQRSKARAPGRVAGPGCSWKVSGCGPKVGLTHASQVSYRDPLPRRGRFWRSPATTVAPLNENRLDGWSVTEVVTSHSPKKSSQLTTAWAASNYTSQESQSCASHMVGDRCLRASS